MLQSIHAASLLVGLALAQVAPPTVVDVDVVVVGGGSSGVHAAIQLHSKNVKVAVVERELSFGGHFNSYGDSESGLSLDYGVRLFSDVPAVRDFFAYFNASLRVSNSTDEIRLFNFDEGKPVDAQIPIYGQAAMDALAKYLEIRNQYPDLQFSVPDPVPDELLLPFGEFLSKNHLEAIGPIVFNLKRGAGNILAQPTLFMMRYLSIDFTTALLQKKFLVNDGGVNQQLFSAAKQVLGDLAFVDSYPNYVKRFDDHVEVLIINPDAPKLIKAKKILLAIQPSLITFMDYDDNEKSLMGLFNSSYFFNAVIRDSGIPDNVTIYNIDPAAPMSVPAVPNIYKIAGTGVPELHVVFYGSTGYLTINDASTAIMVGVGQAREAMGFPPPNDKVPLIEQIRNHSPFFATVDVEAIRGGFFKRLQALQSQNNTFYTGAAWCTQLSSDLWRFNNEVIVPQILKSLGK